MRRRTLGETLRTIVLTTPFLRATGCGLGQTGGGGCPPAIGEVYSLYPSEVPDGGTCDQACRDQQVVVSFDGGSCAFLVLADGGPGVSCTGQYLCVGGRRPASLLAAAPARAVSIVGSYFAQAARLEAASVTAFQLLSQELSQLRAPAALIAAADRSASDEVRHTQATALLANRYGSKPISADLGTPPRGRSLEEIAIENAVEGCAREAYGALVALWQARHAEDPVVAAAMTTIAVEETQHAELAWAFARWAEPQLSGAAREKVTAARSRALTDLASEAAPPVDPALVSLVGLPTPAESTALLASLAASFGRPASKNA